ncbi:HEPN domain-containing protein [Dehalococcoidia bacterium]|nr:HEPN domain-containing protein [Dehalococcoidia bacterium]
MTEDTRNLSRHRIEKAKDVLQQAELLFQEHRYDGSINRSYYAIFNAIRAILASVSLDSQTHKGVISLFDRYFVKPGTFDKAFSKIAHTAFDVRQVSDYEDFQLPTEEQACTQLDDPKRFVQEIERKQAQFIRGTLTLPTIT